MFPSTILQYYTENGCDLSHFDNVHGTSELLNEKGVKHLRSYFHYQYLKLELQSNSNVDCCINLDAEFKFIFWFTKIKSIQNFYGPYYCEFIQTIFDKKWTILEYFMLIDKLKIRFSFSIFVDENENFIIRYLLGQYLKFFLKTQVFNIL